MNNRRYYSFERNNYFYGKLLTSRDFEDEQNYMNNKRRLINRVLHGAGIVYGLDVVAVDESSVVIQSGLALDSSGREIVVPSTQVVKLSTIRGYSDLKTSSVCLGIAYAEEKTEPVYAVMNKDADAQERQYNHLKEGYELFLQDSRDCVREPLSMRQILRCSDASCHVTDASTMPSTARRESNCVRPAAII